MHALSLLKGLKSFFFTIFDDFWTESIFFLNFPKDQDGFSPNHSAGYPHFYLRNSHEKLRGAIITHVDDILVGGDREFLKFTYKLKQRILIGHNVSENFTFCVESTKLDGALDLRLDESSSSEVEKRPNAQI